MLHHNNKNHYKINPVTDYKKSTQKYYRVTLNSVDREPYSSISNAVYHLNIPFNIPKEMLLFPIEFSCVYNSDADIRVKIGNVKHSNSFDTVSNGTTDLLFVTCKPNPFLYVPRFESRVNRTLLAQISNTQSWAGMSFPGRTECLDESNVYTDRPWSFGCDDPYVISMRATVDPGGDPFTGNLYFNFDTTLPADSIVFVTFYARSADQNVYNFSLYTFMNTVTAHGYGVGPTWQQFTYQRTASVNYTNVAFRFDTDGGLDRKLLVTGFMVSIFDGTNMSGYVPKWIPPYNTLIYPNTTNLALNSDTFNDTSQTSLGIPVPSSLVEGKTINIQLESINGSALPTNNYTLTLGLLEK